MEAFQIRKETAEVPVWRVTLGATRAEGGTRGRTYTIGGETCMPFHLWEGEMPHRPLVAMEVFDVVNEKYPQVLRTAYGDLIHHPAEMARACVEKYGADLISVRLEGTHPEKGNRTPEQAVDLVKQVLGAVPVPLIITGHSNYDKNNEVMKAVAQACSGEKLLLNWVEQDNYRTIAGAALAFGHVLVSQSPIDVNIAKADEYSSDQHGRQTGTDRDGSHDRCHRLWHRIHLFRHGTDPSHRAERRSHAGGTDDRFPRTGMCQDQGIEGDGKGFPGMGRTLQTGRPSGN